jgi:hypothetical protein
VGKVYMRMTEEEYEALLANRRDRNSRQVLERQRSVGNAAKRADEDEGGEKTCGSGRYRIVVTAYRVRDFDPDNIFVKAEIDQIVATKILPDDSSKFVESITKRVVKVTTEAEERTTIEIWKRDDCG